jgi:hypothetical protein
VVNPKAAGVPLGAILPTVSGGLLKPQRLGRPAPRALAPLGASAPAVHPASNERAPAPEPSKREPSLVILSRQIVGAVRRPRRGAHFQPPAPPPSSHRAAAPGAEPKRRSTDATQYSVQVGSVYATPVRPANPHVLSAHATESDPSWEADAELFTNSKARARTLLVFLGVALAGTVALARWL